MFSFVDRGNLEFENSLNGTIFVIFDHHIPFRLLQHLVLKLWSKSDNGGSQVLGFTTIDLRPLLAGMPNLSGWYNIVDFTGLCQGQIKCGVTPITPVGKRDDVKEFCSPRNPTPPQFKVNFKYIISYL